MLELAKAHDSGELVRIGQIAEEHGIPSRFLVQILLQLKGAGLVASTRGASGGYRLIKSPAEVTLGDVMSLVDGSDEPITSSASAQSPAVQVLLACWRKIAQVERESLGAITFADLVERQRRQTEKNMYYI